MDENSITPAELLIRRKQAYYTIAARSLNQIFHHPNLTTQNYSGYFLSIENIEKIIGLDPEKWYVHHIGDDQTEIRFSELPEEDQKKVTAALEAVKNSRGRIELENACSKCGALAYEFDQNIIGLKREGVTPGKQ